MEEGVGEYLEPIHRMYSCNNEHYTDEVIVQAYLDGLAEGRKEGYEQGKNNERELQCGKKNYEKDIEKLEKENIELEEKLKNEISFNEQSQTVKKYKEQIEKMRRCTNCKLLIGGDCPYMWEYKETRKTKKKKDSYCVNYDKWELAE